MKKIKRQPIKWEKIFINQVSIKTLILNIYKELNSTIKKNQTTKFKKWTKDLSRYLQKKTYRWLTGTWKDAPYYSSWGKCKSKPQWDITSHLIIVLMAIIKRTGNNMCCWGYRVKGNHMHYWRWCKLFRLVWKLLKIWGIWRFLKKIKSDYHMI